jgi:hypothetical protein
VVRKEDMAVEFKIPFEDLWDFSDGVNPFAMPLTDRGEITNSPEEQWINLEEFAEKIDYIYKKLKTEEESKPKPKPKPPKLDVDKLENGDVILFSTGIRAIVIKNKRSSYLMYDGTTHPSKNVENYGYDLLNSPTGWSKDQKFRIYRPYKSMGLNSVKLDRVLAGVEEIYSNY